MNKEIKSLAESIKNAVICDLLTNQDALEIVLDTYNTYQEEERDGVDYIFNIESADDLKCCVDGGLTAQEISDIWRGYLTNTTKYFYFGCNYQKPTPIITYKELITNLINWLDDVLPCVLSYPCVYKSFYAHYVTNRMFKM